MTILLKISYNKNCLIETEAKIMLWSIRKNLRLENPIGLLRCKSQKICPRLEKSNMSFTNYAKIDPEWNNSIHFFP